MLKRSVFVMPVDFSREMEAGVDVVLALAKRCGLVLPPQRRSEKKKLLPFAHIVSAVDFTVASAVAVRTVLDLIRRTGARLTLVHALTNASHHVVYGLRSQS